MNDAPTANRGKPGRARFLVGGAVATALAAVFALVMAILPGSAVAATTICNSQTGNNGGMYYQMWTNGQGSACMTLNSSNSYSTSWSGVPGRCLCRALPWFTTTTTDTCGAAPPQR